MLKPAKSNSFSPAAHAVRNSGPTHKVEVSIWVRLGIPVGLALLAGGLNLAAVRQQLQPTVAYVLTEDLPVGVLLKPEHIRSVEVAGNLDRSLLVTTNDLFQKNDQGSLLSLSESLSRAPRILSKRMTKGELIYRSSLSGRATAERGTEIISIPRSLISGGGQQLQPGQLVHFAVQKKHGSTEQPATYIGPFRVALEERATGTATADQRSTLPLVYQLDDQGGRDESARILHEAALQENQFRLVVIEKYHRDLPTKSAAASAAATKIATSRATSEKK